ncbi:MAG: TolB protein [Pseudonocardiales bacterium]|nr:TolB protein [Pseudonocardiales bacterium]
MAALLVVCGCSSNSAKKSRTGTNRSTSTSAATSATASALNLAGHIVFTRAGRTYGEETVFTARADGGQVKQIGEPMTTCCPRLSPNGRKIVVTGPAPDGVRATAVVLNYDGTGAKRLPLPTPTLNLGVGAWSPDGTHLALQGWDDAHPERAGIFITNADGTHPTRVTTAPDGAGADTPIDYSPNGRKLLVFRESPVQSVGSLWTLEIGNRHWDRLTPPSLKVAIGGRWSPDGSTIVFAAGRDQATGPLYTIHSDGTGLTEVFPGDDGRFALTPTWSPDGAKLMFSIDPSAAEFSHPDNGLYVMSADGTGLTLVIGGPDFKREADWAA